jgi:TctA family transporter
MTVLSFLADGFAVALQPTNLFYCFFGVLFGMLIGVLPGIGALAAISMLLPLSFYLEPTSALIMLAGIYYGAQYGGSTVSILLNIPGDPASAVTCLDGHPLAMQGRAGVALMITSVASFVGGIVGIAAMIAFAPLLSGIAFAFSAAEYFSLMLLGLIAASVINQGNPLKGIAMVLLGLVLGTIGTDVNTGIPRFTLGYFELYSGISLVAFAMGLFGVTEVIVSANQPRPDILARRVTLRSMIPTRRDIKEAVTPTFRGGVLGTLVGALPGAGAMVASYLSYAVEKKVSRTPDRFGKGAIAGIAAPESSNNAAAQTAFLPTLTLAIPGSATMAIILGALMIHGVVPGPTMMDKHPDLFWGLMASFFVGNIILLILNIPLIGIWVRLLQIPPRMIYPVIIILICIGVYSVNNSLFDVGVTLVFGIFGYFMRLTDLEPAPLILGFVLGPLLEENFRRALLIARGDIFVFFERPVSAAMLFLVFALLAWGLFTTIRQSQRKTGSADGPGASAMAEKDDAYPS